MSNVSGIIKSIQDIMRKDVGVDGDAQRISQLVWMFFLKIFDDREAELELLEDNYKSPLPEHLRWRNWAKDPEGMTGEELSDFVNLQLFPTLKNKLTIHGPTGKRALVVRDVFEDAYNYMKSGTLMRQVINKICEIDFNTTERPPHLRQHLRTNPQRPAKRRQCRRVLHPPRRHPVHRRPGRPQAGRNRPRPGLRHRRLSHLHHRPQARATTSKPPDDEETLQASIRGVEKKALPHMLCITNMILHGIDTPTNINHDNTLSRPYAGLQRQGPRERHRHQPALRRHGRRRHRKQLPRHLPHPRNRRSVPGADHHSC